MISSFYGWLNREGMNRVYIFLYVTNGINSCFSNKSMLGSESGFIILSENYKLIDFFFSSVCASVYLYQVSSTAKGFYCEEEDSV